MALGAQRDDVLKEIVGESAKLVLAGVAGGFVGSVLATRVMTALLIEVKPTDLLTFLLTAGLLAAIAMLASYLPARRASLIDPMSAVRYE